MKNQTFDYKLLSDINSKIDGDIQPFNDYLTKQIKIRKY